MIRAEATVFVVDADATCQESLRMLLGKFAVETFVSAEDYLASCTGDEPGCILLELQLPGMSGLDLMEELRSHQHYIPIIVVTRCNDLPTAVHSMKLGATDFFLKPVDPGLLAATSKAVILADAPRRQARSQISDAQARLATLTSRERELLMALMTGKSSKQIAAEMKLSRRTVENHRSHLLAKTGSQNTADLVRFGMLATFPWPIDPHLHSSARC